MVRILLRVYLNSDRPLGPGKVRLLESIGESGSISEAARSMKMSYRSAWLLVDSMTSQFAEAVVKTKLGGRGGGAARLTSFGRAVTECYRRMERAAERAIAKDLAELERGLRVRSRRPG